MGTGNNSGDINDIKFKFVPSIHKYETGNNSGDINDIYIKNHARTGRISGNHTKK